MIVLADKITKSFGSRVLYAAATLQLNAGERWALVGPNGAGKTTFLHILMGLETPDEGTVSFAKGTTIGYLEQETEISGDKTALQEVIDSAKEVKHWERKVHELENKISVTPEGDALNHLLEDYAHAQERFETFGGYELDSRARQILTGLGFPVEDLDKPAKDFSGGWQMRIVLSKLLLRNPDLLLLDEPTNHLDLESVQWFEKFLTSYKGAVLIVSHDRAFMDACVSHVAAIENRCITTYVGNYKSYLKQREDNLEQMRAKRAAQEREIAHMQVFVDKFRYKPKKAAQAQERMKRIEQIKKELVILPEGTKHVHFKFPDPPRTGDEVVSLKEVSKSFGDNHVYKDVNLSFYRGDHVALVGPNGAGKSTMIKLICGIFKPDTGTITLGQNVTRAYYAQHQLEELHSGNTVMQEIDSAAPGWTSSQERKLLGAFLFHGDDVDKRVSVLSGGEKARLALAKMLVEPAPLLLFDEPTNHLDIDSVDILEDALKDFPGTIILISHDEHLVRTIANKVVDIRDHKVTLYDGDYEYYQWKRTELEAQAQGDSNKIPASEKKQAPKVEKIKEQKRAEAGARHQRQKALRKDKKRLAEIEAALDPAHERYDELMKQMADEKLYNDTDKFNQCMQEYQALSKKIPKLEDEWLDLSTKIEEASKA
ncbi:MAG: ATP-binding cassette domain-containing protein [Coriobacteriaceae bacterium]|uniref:ABC-F family ATP-binding cassette domain-containing protein n=1 Tax=Atopobium sp. oral taxon 416 TaxID=712157 RepID=UPI000FEF516B|nr:ATP-binding cassette domain-containing protein [Atopobium sp. oral taxon 416]QUC02211.1 ATP-binding cassette domain-containing protein [Atopobium sp. oral taxon 416]RRF99106.1 MAG: ATP-binding cassette domain-containing protein [Coriobacteriaceae bacterium]